MIPPSPEHRILLCCAGVEPEAFRYVRLRETLSQVADWRQLRQAALHHGVFPSLCRCLSQVAPELIPPAFLQEIRGLGRAQAQRNLRITGELLRLLALLEGQGVVALPFKGPVLAQVAYGDVTLRQFVDLDLLVRWADMPKVKNLLLPLGYRLDHAYTPKQEQVHLRFACEISFHHPSKTILDVHWRNAPDYIGGGPDPALAFARRMPVTLQGKTVFTLSAQDHFLVLCFHGSFDQWSRLSLISDLAHLIQAQPEWDWDAVLQEAEAGRMWRMVLLGLSLAHEVLGAPVPTRIAALATGDRSVMRLRRQVLQSLFSPASNEPGLLLGSFFQWQTRERLRDKLMYIWIRTFFPTVRDWRWLPLPDSRYWLYYFLRPWRLFSQGVLLPLRHRFSREQ